MYNPNDKYINIHPKGGTVSFFRNSSSSSFFQDGEGRKKGSHMIWTSV
jgi:hypothetical protein